MRNISRATVITAMAITATAATAGIAHATPVGNVDLARHVVTAGAGPIPIRLPQIPAAGYQQAAATVAGAINAVNLRVGMIAGPSVGIRPVAFVAGDPIAVQHYSVSARTLAPVAGIAVAAPDAGAGKASAPVDPEAEYDQAVGAMADAFGNASKEGTLIGGGIGALVGCPLGAVTGGTLTALVSAGSLTPVGVVGGCILGGVILGGLGGTIGGAVDGVPALAATAAQQYNRLNAEGLLGPKSTTVEPTTDHTPRPTSKRAMR